jgi:hypothetical protein
MKRARAPKRQAPDFDRLVVSEPSIASVDELWRARGYQLTGARAYRRKDGTFTVRVVWRKRGELVSAVTCTMEGVALA